MKVAILGAGSALGSRLIESFQLGEGPSVAAIAREPAELATAARFPIDLRVADIFDVDSLAQSFSGCSAAVHALPVRLADSKRSAVAFCRAAAQARLRRLVYVGTADVHGPNPPPGTDDKTSLHLQHASVYTQTAIAAERQFTAECRQLGLTSVVLRPTTMFGPRCDWLAQVIAELRAGGAWLANRGNGICNCVYLDNVVAAVRQAFKAKTTTGSAYVVTDHETVTWREFYEAVALELRLPATLHYLSESDIKTSPAETATGFRTTPLPAETVARHHCAWKLSNARAAGELSLKSFIPFSEGIRRSAAWWRFAQGDFAAA